VLFKEAQNRDARKIIKLDAQHAEPVERPNVNSRRSIVRYAHGTRMIGLRSKFGRASPHRRGATGTRRGQTSFSSS
jgi:hypothetical protein